ncbi:hypothetical protein BMS3Bbin10_02423 [bacterium BMS3Bbin10]|nr:hypothetical protein BMS3Bbin10_02423 [bacterium BMS3Bbin10]
MTGKKSDCRTPGENAFTCGLPTPRLDGIPDAVLPLVQLGMPLHGAWLGLCGNRVSAWLEWPGRVCTCKSMAELTTAQIEYLETMRQHYADYLDGVLRDTLMAPESFEEESEDDTPGQDVPELDREAA